MQEAAKFRRNVHVHRVKNGDPSVHPLAGRELRALRRLKREQEPASPFVFISERGSPFTRDGIAKLVARAGVEAGFDHAVHAHMLRHASRIRPVLVFCNCWSVNCMASRRIDAFKPNKEPVDFVVTFASKFRSPYPYRRKSRNGAALNCV